MPEYPCNYTIFHIHNSVGSLLDGGTTPEQNVIRAKELGMTSLGVSDHGTIYSHFQHLAACKKHGIKPILGIELYIPYFAAPIKDKTNRSNFHKVIWAKNKTGWTSIMKLVSKTNDPNYFYYKPRIHIFNQEVDGVMQPGLESFLDGNIMGFSGHMGSFLANDLFTDFTDAETIKKNLKLAYGQYKEKDPNYYRQFLKPNWLESGCKNAQKLEGIFGKDNFFVELQDELDPTDKIALWSHPLIVDCLRQVSKASGVPAMASSDPHYATREDAEYQRLLVSINMKETEESIKKKLDSDDEKDLMVFFGSNNFYIHSIDEMGKKFTPDELELTNKVADQIETYDITCKPTMPEFKLPEFDKTAVYLKDITSDHNKYLMHLIVKGAAKIQPWIKSGIPKKEYWDRIKYETNVVFDANLTDYFLIVWDICQYARNDKIPQGPGRGSSAGCLISLLLGITKIDSLKYNLSFGRFYNDARKGSLPDIDLDFSVNGRDKIIQYIKDKYGNQRVSQILTFQTIKGKNAVKDVMRVKGIGDFEYSNKICESIPDEASIADEIQEAKDDGDAAYNITKWCLDNVDEIKEYYKDPILKDVFDKAMKIEGTKRSQGRHPSGIVITPQNVDEMFPMVLDVRSKDKVIGWDMREVEKAGGVKLDILGVAILDKIALAQELIRSRK